MKLYLEDLILQLAKKSKKTFFNLDVLAENWDDGFIRSVSDRLTNFPDHPLSTAQVKSALRVIQKNKNYFEEIVDIDSFLQNPICRNEPYQTVEIKREVRYLGDNKLGFRFKSYTLRDEMYQNMETLTEQPILDKKNSLWIVPVSRVNLDKVQKFISSNGFDFDDSVVEFLTLAHNSRNQPSFVIDDQDSVVINVQDDELLALCLREIMGIDPA